MGLLKKILGAFGEKSSVSFLKANGYKIISMNYKALGCEIDIIAEKEQTLVFVEVKTRSSENNGLPEEAINFQKARNITKAAQAFMMENKLSDIPVRCDVVSLVINKNDNSTKFKLIEDAIDMQGVLQQKRWAN